MIEAGEERESSGADTTEGGEPYAAVASNPLPATGVLNRRVDDAFDRDPEDGVEAE